MAKTILNSIKLEKNLRSCCTALLNYKLPEMNDVVSSKYRLDSHPNIVWLLARTLSLLKHISKEEKTSYVDVIESQTYRFARHWVVTG